MSRTRDRSTRALTVWGFGYVVVGVIIATAIAWPIYQTERLAVIAAAAAVLAGAVILISRRRGWRPWAIVLTAILVYVVAVVPLAIPSALGSPALLLRGVRDGISGVVIGWKQLLTLSLPLGEYQAVLVPFLVTVFVGVLVAAALVSRPGRWSALAVIAVVAMSAFGVVFGSSATGGPLELGTLSLPAPRQVGLGILLVMVSLVWLVGRARLTRLAALRYARAQTGSVRQGGESFALAARRNVLAVVLVMVALVAGAAIAPAAATLGPREALRDSIDPLLVLRQQSSPLSGYRTRFDSAEYSAPLFRISGDTAGVGSIRLATLDSYNGEDFFVSGAADGETGRFSRLPRTTPGPGTNVQFRITIGSGYSGIWVPVPEGLAAAPTFAGVRAESLSDAFYVGDTASSAIDVVKNGTVVKDGTAGNGLLPGDSYTVFAQPHQSTAAALGSGEGARSIIDANDYPALAAWAHGQKQPRTAAGFAELVKKLRARGYLSHSLTSGGGATKWISALTKESAYTFQPSYSGHSRSRIETLFATMFDRQRRAGENAPDNALVSAIGDDEQFAVAAALLARFDGFESRVVLGVRLSTVPAGGAVPSCSTVCTGSNVAAWVEVRKPGGTWVAFDTSPQFTISPSAITDGEQLPKNPTIPDRVHSDVLDQPKAASDNSNALATHSRPTTGWLVALLPVFRVAGLGVLLLVLLVLPAAVIAVAKVSRRRRRRGARVPEVSIVAAWDELVDGYIDRGISIPRSATRLEVAQSTGRPAATQLALAVDRAVFAEHPPGRDASTESWQLVDTEQLELAASSTFLGRLRVRLNPASFVRQLDPASVIRGMLTLFSRKGDVA